MAKAPAGGTRRVVAAGDVTLDWNLARDRGSAEGITRASCQPGGAALLGELIATVAREMSKGTSARIKVAAPEAPSTVPPMDERFHHRHAVWTPHADGERRVWRVAEFLGIDHAPDSAGVAPAQEDLEAADWSCSMTPTWVFGSACGPHQLLSWMCTDRGSCSGWPSRSPRARCGNGSSGSLAE